MAACAGGHLERHAMFPGGCRNVLALRKKGQFEPLCKRSDEGFVQVRSPGTKTMIEMEYVQTRNAELILQRIKDVEESDGIGATRYPYKDLVTFVNELVPVDIFQSLIHKRMMRHLTPSTKLIITSRSQKSERG
jgi:hypothetical protein